MNQQTDRLLRLPDVLDMVPMGRATMYRRIKEGNFPAPIRDGSVSFWSLNEINAWLEEKKSQRAIN